MRIDAIKSPKMINKSIIKPAWKIYGFEYYIYEGGRILKFMNTCPEKYEFSWTYLLDRVN